MSAGLYDSRDRLITQYVNVVPKKDTVKVENRLLDGGFHVQTIGSAGDVLDVTLQAATEDARGLVDRAEALAEEIRVTYNDRYWIGIIRDNLAWSKQAGVFSTSFELLVLRSGTD